MESMAPESPAAKTHRENPTIGVKNRVKHPQISLIWGCFLSLFPSDWHLKPSKALRRRPLRTLKIPSLANLRTLSTVYLMALEDTPPPPPPASKYPGLRPFPRGVSGNPGGRPKGLVDMVRKKTKDGKLLVDLSVKMATGTLKVKAMDADGNPVIKYPTHADRMDAIKWLSDRGFGKVIDQVEMTQRQGQPPLDPALITAAAQIAKTL